MAESVNLREPGLGGGYQYQWEVAVWLILCVLDARGAMPSAYPIIQDQLAWTGRVGRVRLEGSVEQQELEDITIYGESSDTDGSKMLHVQVKERKDPSARSRWRSSDDEVVEFLRRRIAAKDRQNSRSLFLSNGAVSDDLDELRTDDGARSWRNTYLVPRLRKEHNHRNKKNPALQCPDDQEPPDAPGEKDVIDALKGVFFSSCHGPDRIVGSSRTPSGGVAEVSRGALARFGVADPAEAHRRLFSDVMHLSIREGGVELSRNELGERVLVASGVSSAGGRAFPLPRLRTIIDEGYERRRPGPTWQDHEQDRVFEDLRMAELVSGLLETGVSTIIGPAGSGKTVLASGVAVRFSRDHDACAACWDYEHDGPEEPVGLLSQLYTTASVFGQRPLLLLENVHRASGSLSRLLAAWESADDRCFLILTSRVSIDLLTRFSTMDLQRSEKASLSRTEDTLKSWGAQLLRWLLSREVGLTAAEADKEARRTAWRPLLHNGWLIRHGVDSYKAKGVVSFWAVQDGIAERMARTFAGDTATEDLLYLVVGLGRLDVVTDRDAAALALGWDRTQTARVARLLHDDGWISESKDRLSYLPWHVTLAELYWTCFQIHRDRWARDVRRRFADRRMS